MSEEIPTTPEPDPQIHPDGSPSGDGAAASAADPAVSASLEPDEDEETEHLLPFPLVAIGASAGGLEAYIELFKNLAPDTGMSYVLVPHLSPEHRSHLPNILSHHATIPVNEIENGGRPEPNHVHVLPPNVHLSMRHGTFQLETRHPGQRMIMPIDRFFRSVASDQKNRVVGILLSGADSDGALGLKAIKGEGGIAIVQDPDSARFGDMPRSGIMADHVDLVLPPAQIGTELSRLARQFFQPSLRPLEQGRISPSDEPQFSRILTLLRTVAGVDFRSYKPGTVRRRIARRMVLRRIESLAEYARLVQESRDELRNLHEDVLINVSRFFRDPSVFDTLKTDILPGILQDRTPDQQVRIWVAGCSTGEEAYSIAICVLEYLTGRANESPIQIFGTDASDESISKARAGWYPETIAADVSAERLRRFFVKADKGYQISRRVRDLCIFARQNLTNDPPFSRLDLISCRNVLIYLQADIQHHILSTFHYALRTNGVLLLGRSESVPHAVKLFAPLDRKERFYSKLGDSAPQPLLSGARLGEIQPAVAIPPLPRATIVEDLQRAADRALLARYAPPGVLVNERLEILEVRGRPAPFVSIGPGPASLNLLRMIHADIVGNVRDALHQVSQSGEPFSQSLSVVEAGKMHTAMLEILPIRSVIRGPGHYVVSFIPPSTDTEGAAPVKPEVVENRAGAEENLDGDRLRRELTSSRVYLQSLIEERDSRNQELMAAYEEIQSANEELQSTNEELETAKEELQSGNEELHTVNDELRNRNTALVQASNDFNNLLNSVNIPVIMLGSDLTIRQFTPPAERLMRLRAADIGRPISEIRMNLMVDDLEPLIHEVADTLATKETEVQDRSGRWHVLRLRPYRTSENKIEGVVMVLLDIDVIKRSQEALQRTRDFAQTVVEAVQVPVIVLDDGLRIRTANAAFRTLSALSSPDLERRSFTELLTLVWDWPNLREPLQRLLQNGADSVIDLEHETSRPSVRYFRLVARAIRADVEAAILIMLEDITSQKVAERLLEADRERLTGQVQSTTEVLGRTREELHALAARLFNSQEEERRGVARELHDDISQRLALLEMDIETLRKGLPADPAAIKTELERLRRRSRDLAEEVREISHQLHPSALDHLGIATALKSLVEEFGSREGMVATFHSRNVPEKPRPEVAVTLYRIAQEALRNVAKHAGRTHVKMMLEGVDQQIRLEVRDFGEGFDMEENKGNGLGLISMVERARLIGGTLAVQSALGEGTAISVSVPQFQGETQ